MNDWIPVVTIIIGGAINIVIFILSKRERGAGAEVDETMALKQRGEYRQGIIDSLAEENGFLKETIKELRTRIDELEAQIKVLKDIIRQNGKGK